MAAVPFLVIQPRTCPSPPLTRYKRGGYLCQEWYHRALSTAILCTAIRSTVSSTPSAQLVSFILRLRTSRSWPEFPITRRLFTKVLPSQLGPSESRSLDRGSSWTERGKTDGGSGARVRAPKNRPIGLASSSDFRVDRPVSDRV